MTQRLALISSQLLNSPYAMYVLGDGANSSIDQCPLIRLDKFDCETFVTSTLALALSKDEKGYEQCLRAIRYAKGEVDFLTRHHFTSIEWNLENQRQGRVRDITRSIVNNQQKAVFKWSKTQIDKGGWLKNLSALRVRLIKNTQKAAKLDKLKQQAKQYKKIYAKLAYIPLTALFSKNGDPQYNLFAQIPDGAIIEIVRPNWNVKDKIGTNLDVSHMGFAFRHSGTLFFRNASYTHHKVVDEPLIEYLKRAQANPTIKGINIQIVLPDARC